MDGRSLRLGFTNTIAVSNADANGCPTAPLAWQIFCPISGWNRYSWNVNVGSNFVVAVTHGPGSGNPLAYPSDHPAAGPTGPTACGLCYPTTRANHSYHYGTSSSPLCPGASLNDGTCAAQWIWNAQVSCTVSVEESSFGSIKNLYR